MVWAVFIFQLNWQNVFDGYTSGILEQKKKLFANIYSLIYTPPPKKNNKHVYYKALLYQYACNKNLNFSSTTHSKKITNFSEIK